MRTRHSPRHHRALCAPGYPGRTSTDNTLLDLARIVALIFATLTMAVMTGVFQLYAYAIMPGLRRTDDHTFVAAFQQIDTAIINPWFPFSSRHAAAHRAWEQGWI